MAPVSKKQLQAGGKAAVGCCIGIMKEFRDFILRGNVVDLAVAIVVGGALKDLVNAFVAAFITPLIGMIGTGNANDLYFVVLGSKFNYGLFINALLSFIIICTMVFFFIVLPLMRLLVRVYGEMRVCPECLQEDIPGKATRCKYCCASLPPLHPELVSSDEIIKPTTSGATEVQHV